MSHVEATLSREALLHNLSIVRLHCPTQKIWAMVKADAYGHGAQWTVNVLSDVDAFGVATLEEALLIKSKKPIYVMRGFLNAKELAIMQENNIGAVLHCFEQLELLSHLASKMADNFLNFPYKAKELMKVWIKIDSGMHRLGFQPEDLSTLQETLRSLPIKIEGFMTHLAKADELGSDMTEQQSSCFETQLPADSVKSIANSAGILAHPRTHGDWVRPGLMLYGVSPFSNKSAMDLNLKPVMTVEAPILALKKIRAGMGVGYGQIWQAPRDTQIAIVGMGYGDGYPREVVGATVCIENTLYPVIGRVSMDLMAVDLQQTNVSIGSMARIWGEGHPVELLAEASNTIPYTLLTRVNKRVFFNEDNRWTG